MKTVSVKINGLEYNLKGNEDEKYLLEVAGYVDSKIREIGANKKNLGSTSVAVLAAINIADQLHKCDQEVIELDKKRSSLEERHEVLKERIKELRSECELSLSDKDKQIVSLNETITLANEKLVKYDELVNISKKYDEAKDLIDDLNNKLKDEKSLILSLQEERSKDKQLISSQTQELSTYKDMIINDYVDKEEHNSLIDQLEEANNKIAIYKSEIDDISEIKEEYKKLQLEIEKFTEKENLFKQKEEEFNLIKNAVEEVEVLKGKLEILMGENERLKRTKKLLEDKYKETSFDMKNYKYKVLDLEKKLIDCQIMLAKERMDKNPLIKK